MRKQSVYVSSILLGVLAACYGCENGSAHGNDSSASPSRPELASVSFAQLGDFSGNSVSICGFRGSPGGSEVDPKYPPCLIELCDCYEFEAEGTLAGGPIEGLCPSENLPGAGGEVDPAWTFTFEIWTDAGCTGEVLNAEGNPNNFACYDSNELSNPSAVPNTIVEPLQGGENVNHIICTSEGSSKQWSFRECVPLAEEGLYDCDCELVEDTCTCGEVLGEDLPEGCSFFGPECYVDCRPLPPAFTCANKWLIRQDPDNAAQSRLDRLDLPANPADLGTLVQVGIFNGALNAIGVNPFDGQIYGVTAEFPTTSVQRNLIRAGSDGTFVDLGPVPGLTWRNTAGAFLQDGTLLVYSQPPPQGIGRFTWIDVTEPRIIRTFDPPVPAPDYADIAVRPQDGAIVAYNAADSGPTANQLGFVDPNTGAFAPLCFNFPGGQTGWVMGASLFDQMGNLFLYGSHFSGAGTSDQLLQVSLPFGGFPNCTPTVRAQAPAVAASDGASCSVIGP